MTLRPCFKLLRAWKEQPALPNREMLLPDAGDDSADYKPATASSWVLRMSNTLLSRVMANTS